MTNAEPHARPHEATQGKGLLAVVGDAVVADDVMT